MRYNLSKLSNFILAPLGAVLTYLFITRNRISHKIADNISVSSEWTEISTPTSVKFKKNIQELRLHINGCWQNFHEKDLRISDGTIVKPEIKIIDKDNIRPLAK